MASKRTTRKPAREITIRIFVEGREITEDELPMAVAEAGRTPARWLLTPKGEAVAAQQRGEAI